MGIGFKRTAVLLIRKGFGEGFTEGDLADTGGPKAEAKRELLGDHSSAVVFVFLRENYAIRKNFLDARVGEDSDALTGKFLLKELGYCST
jgi:hypothetical protein